jgi:hypothetical protein
MTTPATTVTVEPGAIAGLTVERRRREPTPTVRPALANRAAGRLRADAAATAPEDVGFAETHYKRTTQDDAEVAAYQAATTQGASARAPSRRARAGTGCGAYRGPAAPADTGLAGTRYERTAQDEADVAAKVTPQATTGTAPAEAGPTDALTAGRYAGAGPVRRGASPGRAVVGARPAEVSRR